jgi:hypothetical protein
LEVGFCFFVQANLDHDSPILSFPLLLEGQACATMPIFHWDGVLCIGMID